MATKNESESKGEQPERKPKLNEEQYKILKSCSEKKDITEWKQYRNEHPYEEIWLQGAYLLEAHLEGAKLWGVHLEGAKLQDAHLEGAKLWGVHLEGAKLWRAHLEGAELWEAHLEGADLARAALQDADFSRAIVDGKTLIWNCKISRKTKFEGVALGNIRIYPQEKQLLEYNIRRMNWEEWYRGKSENKLIVAMRILATSPVRLFWCLSNYGLSTWRIIIWFFGLALVFAGIYAYCAYWSPPGIVSDLMVEPYQPAWHCFLLALVRPIYFSVVTMTTLGFGDMYANANSIWGHILLTFQVILGYVLLGALVTRFAVLFTAGGPAGKFSKEKKEGEEGRI